MERFTVSVLCALLVRTGGVGYASAASVISRSQASEIPERAANSTLHVTEGRSRPSLIESLLNSRVKREDFSSRSDLNTLMIESVQARLNVQQSIKAYTDWLNLRNPDYSVRSRESSYICSSCYRYTSHQNRMKRRLTQFYCLAASNSKITFSSAASSEHRATQEALLSSLNQLICRVSPTSRCKLPCPDYSIASEDEHILSGYDDVLYPLDNLLYCFQSEIMALLD